jgi:deoxyribonuclease IV
MSLKPPVREYDELGAHVSTAGGVALAPARAHELGSCVLQLFTKQPNRWAEKPIDPAAVRAFAEERGRCGLRALASHDSYLINLATPDPVLFARSYSAFRAELDRCVTLDLDFLVTHPGHATGGDRAAALTRNAEAIGRALHEAGGRTRVLLETTAGGGTALGADYAELARLREAVPAPLRDRVGVCLDTCHVWAAGYDLRSDYQGVLQAFDDTIGLEHLGLIHLNDSVAGRGSRRDRHAGIAEGELGEEPFRRIMSDERLWRVPKVIETPKGAEPIACDRRNLARLRGYRAG